MTDDTRPALIVDGLSVFHSCAGPAARLTNGYTYSFVTQLTAAVKRFKPKGIFVCWDRGSKMRKELLPTYKNRESSMTDVKRKYHDDVVRFLNVVGADQLWAEGYEADDVGAMLANTLERAVLVSNDKDWVQLVRPGISIWHKCAIGGGFKSEKREINATNFTKIWGYNNPEEFVMALCAIGDGVDNIDGLYGVGDTVIKAYLMGMEVGPTKKKLLDDFYNGSEHYERNRKLIDLRGVREIPGLMTIPGKFDEGRVKSLLEELTFASMLKNFPAWVQPYKEAYADISSVS